MWQLWKTVGKCQSEVCKIFAWTSRACPLLLLIYNIGKPSFSISGSVFIYLKLGIIIAKVAIWNIFVLFCFPLASFRFVLLLLLCAGLSFSRTRKLGILGNYANVSISIKWFWWGTKVDFMLGWLWLGLCGDRRVRSALLPFNWSVE